MGALPDGDRDGPEAGANERSQLGSEEAPPPAVAAPSAAPAVGRRPRCLALLLDTKRSVSIKLRY